MTSRALVFVFPGQSSRDPGMFDRLAGVHKASADAALEALESKLGHRFGAAFATNHEIQLAVFGATQAWLALLHDAGLHCQASAGLSLGEYSHLVAIGALTADAARDLVAQRGQCYDAGPAGVMAALFPLALDDLEALCARVCEELLDPQAVCVANINSPTQNVVAGTARGVDRLLNLAEELHYVSGQIIEHRIPMHVPLFSPASTMFRPALQSAPWRTPHAHYWPNVDAQAIAATQPVDFVDRLTRHVWQPVLWRATVDAMEMHYEQPIFVEVGPLQVLTKMMNRKWIDPKRVFSIDQPDQAHPAGFARRIEEIQHAISH